MSRELQHKHTIDQFKEVCNGTNCNASKARPNHSEECKAEHDAAYGNLSAIPSSAPEGFALVPVVPTHAILDVMFNAGIDMHDVDLTLIYRAMLAAAPTLPVSEDRKDAERFREGWTHACNALCMEIALWIERCPHCGMPAPKAPAMQEDKP